MTELFSREFTKDVWAQRAAELSVSSTPFHEIGVLEALRQYAYRPTEIRALNAQSEAITAVGGQRTAKPREDLLVSDHDKTFEDYVARIENIVNGAEWTVMYYGLYAASPTLWDAAKQFSDDLALSIGYRPGGRVDIDCFIGRYSSTYIGIHVDHAHNFGFTLRDGKTMFTWPGTRSDLAGKRWPDYEIFKAEGTPLANRTDRVAYFPEDSLHVAETKQDVSVNVNIAFWETGNDTQVAADYIKSALTTSHRKRHDIRSSGLTTLNQDNALLLSSLQSIVNNDSLKRHMLISQLISDTSGRLNVGRPLVEVNEIEETISINSISTIQWVPMLETGDVLIAANGHCTSFSYSNELLDFLTRISEGSKIDLAALQESKRGGKKSDILDVVSALAQWGVL